jgi:periplasmic protein TonB
MESLSHIMRMEKVKSNYNFGKLNGVYLEYFENGQLKVESNYKNGKLHEKFKEYFENGKLRKEIDYKEEKFNGMVLTYWKNGKSKRIAKYENDSLIIGECFDANGEKSLYFDYWIPATCSGGVKGFIEYLNYELHYPEYSRRKEIEGKVIVRFIVSEYGDISEIKVIQSVSKELDAEAIRVIKKMPKWEPSLLDGEPVRMSQLVPIVFKLTD